MILVAAVVALVGVRFVSARERLWCGVTTIGALSAGAPPLRLLFEQSLPWHMVGHVVTMFLLPMPLGWIVAHRATRLGPPWIAIGLVNVTMVLSHVPRVFDAVMEAGAMATEAQNVLFFATGTLFFSVVFRSSTPLRWSAGGVILTMFVMLALAMSLSIFTSTAWYTSVGSMPGMVMPSDFAAQQLAAAILWICGDLWAVPVLVWLLRVRIAREGSLLALLDRYSVPESRR